MATVFWDSIGILLTKFMKFGTTINATVYYETLCKFRRAIQNKRRGMLSKVWCFFLHDEARTYTATCTKTLVVKFNWDICLLFILYVIESLAGQSSAFCRHQCGFYPVTIYYLLNNPIYLKCIYLSCHSRHFRNAYISK